MQWGKGAAHSGGRHQRGWPLCKNKTRGGQGRQQCRPELSRGGENDLPAPARSALGGQAPGAGVLNQRRARADPQVLARMKDAPRSTKVGD